MNSLLRTINSSLSREAMNSLLRTINSRLSREVGSSLLSRITRHHRLMVRLPTEHQVRHLMDMAAEPKDR
jgi:hypothetical protein